jgi:hypothetical protein
MPYFDTKDGRKQFSYSTLSEFEEAVRRREEEVFPASEIDFFGELVTEIDVDAIREGTCAFGSEFQTLEAVLQMLENYENSDSHHSIVDFFNQNHIQHLVLGSRARGILVRCHAEQAQYNTSYRDILREKVKQYKSLLEKYGDRNNAYVREVEEEIRLQIFKLMESRLQKLQYELQRALSYNNTAVAVNLCNEIILEGQKAFERMPNFSDTFTNDLKETIEEVDELIEEFRDFTRVSHLEELEV